MAVGLRYLIDPFGGLGHHFTDMSIDHETRNEAIRSMRYVFRDLFLTMCTSRVARAEVDALKNTYAGLCYMWWDIFPRHGVPRMRAAESMDSTILETIAYILTLPNLACQESALHGLGHWHHSAPEFVERTISEFLPCAPSELVAYAHAASKGDVQ